MTKSLLAQIDFGDETGDMVDPEELSSYFVEQESFATMLNPKKRFAIATAKKGIGKSALLQWISYRAAHERPDALVIRCRGSDLTRAQFGLTSPLVTPNDYIRDWMVRICALANRRLAADLGIALSDDRMTLVESAEIEGFKARNLVGALTARFKKLLGRLTPEPTKAQNDVELLKRANSRQLWILVDDMDATFQNTSEECLSIATFISACRYLTQDVKDVIFRISLRSNVWSVIRRFDESLDKVDQYVSEITWQESDFRRILYRRIRSQIDELGLQHPVTTGVAANQEALENKYLELVFVPRSDWGYEKKPTYRVIYTVSYQRPRWGIQLCKLCQKEALPRDALISRGHIDAVWGDYGTKRIADLVAEHKHQCKQIEELVNAFRGAERLMKRDELIAWIKSHITNHLVATIDGRQTRSPVEIAHFLYQIGFIVARSDEPQGYEHYSFEMMPDFLTSRTNDDFGMSWEIHPCYREALDIVKMNKAKRDKMIRARQVAAKGKQ
jgi:hypothetical protein